MSGSRCFCRSKTVDETADEVHLSVHTVQGLYRRFVTLISEHQTKENEALQSEERASKSRPTRLPFTAQECASWMEPLGRVDPLLWYGGARFVEDVWTGSCEAQVKKEEGTVCEGVKEGSESGIR